jgi:FkbM family methyltransferase
MSAFVVALMQELTANMSHWYGSDNWDAERYGPQGAGIKSRVASALNRWSFGRFAVVYPDAREVIRNLESIGPQLEALSWLYERLADGASRSTLIKILAYRLQGAERVRLPLSNPQYWRDRRALEALAGNERIAVPGGKWPLRRLALAPLGFPIDLFMVPMGAFATFCLRQYEYRKDSSPIAAEVGDQVIDAGGCWGDTALYFAHRTGPGGRVFSFEFLPSNLAIFERNLALNPQLATRIEVVRKALWDRSGAQVSYSANGSGTALGKAGGGDGTAETFRLDDPAGPSRADFIKMDIEGAELNALRGAERTIRRDRPNLAIAVYHSLTDLTDIPRLIDAFDSDYELFLDHFTIHREETILFARHRSRRGSRASA